MIVKLIILTLTAVLSYYVLGVVSPFVAQAWPVVVMVALAIIIGGPELGRLRYVMQRTTGSMVQTKGKTTDRWEDVYPD